MHFSSALVTAYVGATIFGYTQRAESAEVGQCFDVEQINRTMIGEGQMSIAAANEPEELPGTGLRRTWGWIFTKNATSAQGYAIRTNASTTVPFTQACIMQKLHAVSLDDVRLQSIPPDVLISFTASRSDMGKVCEKERAGNICGFHNEILGRWNDRGSKVILHGSNTEGKLIILVGDNSGEQNGVLTETYRDSGVLVVNHEFQGVGYTPKGRELVESGNR